MNRNNTVEFTSDMIPLNSIHSKLLFTNVTKHHSGYYFVHRVVRDFSTNNGIIDTVTIIYVGETLDAARSIAKSELPNAIERLYDEDSLNLPKITIVLDSVLWTGGGQHECFVQYHVVC